jgi:hypothetical protein
MNTTRLRARDVEALALSTLTSAPCSPLADPVSRESGLRVPIRALLGSTTVAILAVALAILIGV